MNNNNMYDEYNNQTNNMNNSQTYINSNNTMNNNPTYVNPNNNMTNSNQFINPNNGNSTYVNPNINMVNNNTNGNQYINPNNMNGNQYVNSNYNMDSSIYVNPNDLNNKKKKNPLKIVTTVTGILIVLFLAGFGLVYTGVIKINYVSPKSMLLNVGNVALKKGREYQLEYQVYPENTSVKNVYFESSDPSVMEVNEVTGYVTAKKNGSAYVVVKTKDNQEVVDTTLVTVTNDLVPAEKLILSSEKLVFDLSNTTSKLLKVSTEPSNATDKKFDFFSGDENVAIVDEKGYVTPVGFGRTKINVTTKDGSVKTTCDVVVTDSKNKKVYFTGIDNKKIIYPYAIELETDYIKLKPETTRKVGFTLLPPDVTEDVVSWISADSKIATVKDGVVRGEGLGITTVTAITVNDLVAKLTVEITNEDVEITELETREEVIVLDKGERKNLNIKYDATATSNELTYKSNDEKVAIVSSEGEVKAVGVGETKIIISTKNGLSTEVIVKVNSGPEDTVPVIDNNQIKIDSGSTLELPTTNSSGEEVNAIYKSSNSDILDVDSKTGVIAGGTSGETVVTLETSDGVNIPVTVKVEEVPIAKIDIKYNKNVVLGEKLNLEYNIYPINATNKNITWKSSNENIATVSQTGEVTSKALGSVEITATSVANNEIYRTIVINVVKENSSSLETEIEVINEITENDINNIVEVINTYVTFDKVNVAKINSTLEKKGLLSKFKKFVLSYNNKKGQEIKIDSSNGKDEDLKIPEDANNINVTLYDSKEKEIKNIKMEVLPYRIDIDNYNKTVSADKINTCEKLNLIFIPAYSTNKKVKYESSNNNVATISENSEICYKSTGNVDINVISETDNDVQRKISIEVTSNTNIDSPKRSTKTEYTDNDSKSTSKIWKKIYGVAGEKSNEFIGNNIGKTNEVINAVKDQIKNLNVNKEVVPTAIRVIDTKKGVEENSECFKISYLVLPTNATNKDVELKSDNSSVATIKNGSVCPQKEGSAKITITSKADQSIKVSTSITVKKKKVDTEEVVTTENNIEQIDEKVINEAIEKILKGSSATTTGDLAEKIKGGLSKIGYNANDVKFTYTDEKGNEKQYDSSKDKDTKLSEKGTTLKDIKIDFHDYDKERRDEELSDKTMLAYSDNVYINDEAKHIADEIREKNSYENFESTDYDGFIPLIVGKDVIFHEQEAKCKIEKNEYFKYDNDRITPIKTGDITMSCGNNKIHFSIRNNINDFPLGVGKMYEKLEEDDYDDDEQWARFYGRGYYYIEKEVNFIQGKTYTCGNYYSSDVQKITINELNKEYVLYCENGVNIIKFYGKSTETNSCMVGKVSSLNRIPSSIYNRFNAELSVKNCNINDLGIRTTNGVIVRNKYLKNNVLYLTFDIPVSENGRIVRSTLEVYGANSLYEINETEISVSAINFDLIQQLNLLAPDSLSLNQSHKLKVGVILSGEKKSLKYNYNLSGYVGYKSYNRSILSVDNDGILRVEKEPDKDTKVNVEVYSLLNPNIKSVKEVTVKGKNLNYESISLAPGNTVVKPGQTLQLSAYAKVNGKNATIPISELLLTSNNKNLEVGNDGKVKIGDISKGFEGVITATLKSNHSLTASSKIKVIVPQKEYTDIKLRVTEKTLVRGAEYNLNVFLKQDDEWVVPSDMNKYVSYISSYSGNAKVKDGKVTIVAPDSEKDLTVTITAKLNSNGKTAKLTIKIPANKSANNYTYTCYKYKALLSTSKSCAKHYVLVNNKCYLKVDNRLCETSKKSYIKKSGNKCYNQNNSKTVIITSNYKNYYTYSASATEAAKGTSRSTLKCKVSCNKLNSNNVSSNCKK